jgi:hypothetical protein
MVRRQHSHLRTRHARWIHEITDVPLYHLEPHSRIERFVKQHVHVMYRRRAQPFCKLLRIEGLQVLGRQLREYHAAKRGKHMYSEVLLVPAPRAWPNLGATRDCDDDRQRYP